MPELAAGIEIVPAPKPKKPEAPAVPPVPAGTPTAEELRARTVEMYKSMGWGEPPVEEAPTPTPAPEPEPVEPPAPAPAAPAPAPAAVEPEPAAQPRQPDPQELIDRTARAVARELKPTPAAPEPPKPDFEIDPQDARDLEIVGYLERTQPKWAGMRAKYLDYLKKFYAYAEKWMTEHTDEEFNPEADEHVAYAESINPGITAEDIDQGRIDMQVEAKVDQQIKEKVEPERQARARDQAWQQALPQVVQSVNRAVYQMVQAVDPNLATLLTDNPTEETIAKVDAADPIAREVLDTIVAQELQPQIVELEKLNVPGLDYRLDPQRNPLHARLVDFTGQQEQALLDAPAEARQMDGRQFVTLADYADRVNAIMKAHPDRAEQGRELDRLDREVWTLNADMLKELLADQVAKRARKIIDRRNETARKKFGTSPAPANPPAPAPAPAPPPAPMPAGMKPRPPAVGGSADVVTTRTPGTNPQKTFTEAALDVAFSR